MVFRQARRAVAKIPIKLKLTLWSAFILFLLFAGYNAVQYFFVEKWMVNQERQSTEQNMSEIINYFLERESAFTESELTPIRNFLNKVNEKNQLIRVLDEQGNRIVAASNGLPEEWVEPAVVSETLLHRSSYDGHSLLIMRSPLTIFQFQGTIEIVKSMDDFDKMIHAVYRVMTAFGIGALVLSGLGGGLLAWQLLKPLQAMADTIRSVKQKGLHERMPVKESEDEIAALMRMFNEMMDEVERSFQQQRQFVEDASHELRTPIAIIEGHLALLHRWGKNDPIVLAESLDVSIEELKRLKGLVEELLMLSRAEREEDDIVQHRLVNPAGEINRMIAKVALIYPAYHFEAHLNGLDNTILGTTSSHLEQVLLIVLDNAVKHSQAGSAVSVHGYVEHGQAIIDIRDEGEGIAAEDLPYVFDRFYRADRARVSTRGGYGLGLSIAKHVVERYKGEISIQSKTMEGTTVRIMLPTRTHQD
ncbi:sensor histidine kinase [Paenibacillaceae bacterium]|nr:sensor histidine kinase [Paenibacillaceae bacterium]